MPSDIKSGGSGIKTEKSFMRRIVYCKECCKKKICETYNHANKDKHDNQKDESSHNLVMNHREAEKETYLQEALWANS